jgi:hypothetical protein
MTLHVASRARRVAPKHCAHHASTRVRKATLTRRERIARTPGPSRGQGATPRRGTAAARAEVAPCRGHTAQGRHDQAPGPAASRELRDRVGQPRALRKQRGHAGQRRAQGTAPGPQGRRAAEEPQAEPGARPRTGEEGLAGAGERAGPGTSGLGGGERAAGRGPSAMAGAGAAAPRRAGAMVRPRHAGAGRATADARRRGTGRGPSAMPRAGLRAETTHTGDGPSAEATLAGGGPRAMVGEREWSRRAKEEEGRGRGKRREGGSPRGAWPATIPRGRDGSGRVRRGERERTCAGGLEEREGAVLGEGMTGGPPPGGGGGVLTACARRARWERGKAAGPPCGPKAGEGDRRAGPRLGCVRGGKGQAAPRGKPAQGGEEEGIPLLQFLPTFLLSILSLTFY